MPPKISQSGNRGTSYLNLKVLHKHFCLQDMEGVEIITTLEIMVDNSPAMGPWKETALVAETLADPMVVSVSLQVQIYSIRISISLRFDTLISTNPKR